MPRVPDFLRRWGRGGTSSLRRSGAPVTYRDAGVDIDAGDAAVERIKEHVRSTFRRGVIGDLGGFGGLFEFDAGRYRSPVLVSSTDGVGTKSMVAALAGRYRTIGIDLVAMNVDDVASQGAEPLFFLDYVSFSKLDTDAIDDLVAGVAEGCRQAGCALVGGEMSQHPGAMEPGEFDLVGFTVGAVERSRLLPKRVEPGCRLIGLASPGLRCNGYALARKVFFEVAGMSPDDPAWDGAHHSIADELLVPSVIYAPAMLELREHVDVRGFAHVTGGGIPGNLPRVLPDDCDAVVERGRWEEPRIFAEIRDMGNVPDAEMERVFNLGIGMVVVVPAADAHHAVDRLRLSGRQAWDIGEVVRGSGRARLTPAGSLL